MLHAPVSESKQRKSSRPSQLNSERQREFHPPLAGHSQRNAQWNFLQSAYGNQAALRMMSGQGVQAENGDPDQQNLASPAPAPTPAGGGGGASATMPRAALEEFRTSGNTDPDNCCAFCPISLGVGRGGSASNGMEMRFRIDGPRAGVGYDILRTRATSFWERGHAGATDWTMLESEPMGTNDDHTSNDECLIPHRSKIFSIDAPGDTRPTPIAGGSIRGMKGTASHADATELVAKFNFAEWVNAKDFSAGTNWQTISNPTFTFWHSIMWLTRDAANNWILDTGRSEIALGSILSDITRPPA